MYVIVSYTLPYNRCKSIFKSVGNSYSKCRKSNFTFHCSAYSAAEYMPHYTLIPYDADYTVDIINFMQLIKTLLLANTILADCLWYTIPL